MEQKNKMKAKALELMELLSVEVLYGLSNGTFYTTHTSAQAACDGGTYKITEFKKSDNK